MPNNGQLVERVMKPQRESDNQHRRADFYGLVDAEKIAGRKCRIYDTLGKSVLVNLYSRDIHGPRGISANDPQRYLVPV